MRTATGGMAFPSLAGRKIAAVDRPLRRREVSTAGHTGPVSERRVRAYVGLGANVGDAEATLADAVSALAALPGVHLRGVSRLYATAPVGVTDQPEFRNAAVALDVPAGPDPQTGALDLLACLKELERAFGRRKRRRWGPRELDLDLLVFGQARLAVERSPEARSIDADTDPAKGARLLTVPHAAAASRLFVLAPLADLAPGLVPPGWGTSVETARRRQAGIEGPDAVRPVADWDAGAVRWRRVESEPDAASQPR
jgi:2-amino-4-hydroxy-6-hydroxymethyldihydropteridine diphosphokinase